jgi:hypothetical protein
MSRMKIAFPSREFDEAVAAVCHDLASNEQVSALNELLRGDTAARDEYILRLELHSRLASEPELFVSEGTENLTRLGSAGFQPAVSQISNLRPAENSSVSESPDALPNVIRRYGRLEICATALRRAGTQKRTWVIALAACLALLAAGFWSVRQWRTADRRQATSKAVAMLNRTADAQWSQGGEIPRLNAPLEPGRLRLEAGLAQIIFYSGARIVVEGPAELQLISQNEAFFHHGRIAVEIPAQARGFLVKTPHITLTDPGISIGLDVKDQQTGLHVFKGNVKWTTAAKPAEQNLREGAGALIESDRALISVAASPSTFASLFDFQARSQAAEARRYDQWRTACKRLEKDASLLLHFNFENVAPSGWQIPNIGNPRAGVSDATIVGCQWTEGRWPEKRALEFQSVNDRVRLTVPGEFQSLTLSAWVSVKGLDRKINSLFMSDGFEPRTVHWLIRRDGVLGLTAIGANRGDHQIVVSPSLVTLEKFGMWLHLAVVLDSVSERVVHYVNGVPVSETPLKIAPPFHIGAAELGNWNAKGFPENDPFMIRNFSGAIDEFGLFNRALNPGEIRALYTQGKPQGDMVSVR